jgi:uncharacterized protein (DUF849 family)
MNLGIFLGAENIKEYKFLYNWARETLGEFTWSTCAIGRFQFPMCIGGGMGAAGIFERLN